MMDVMFRGTVEAILAVLQRMRQQRNTRVVRELPRGEGAASLALRGSAE